MKPRFTIRKLMILVAVLALLSGIEATRRRRAFYRDMVLPPKPMGGYADPEEGERYEEGQRREAVELSRRKETGQIRCVLKVRPGAAAREEPELEVEFRNTSDDPVTIPVHRTLLDDVRFVLRDPKGEVVGSFCYRNVHSTFGDDPPVTLRPGQTDVSPIYLSVAASHGYRPLPPGEYSLEAIFFAAVVEQEEGLLARSQRIPIQVK